MSDQFNPVRVEVDNGVVTGAMSHGFTTRWLPELIGKRRYWIDLVEADGGRLGVWDGDSEADALREAETIRADWGIAAPVAIVGKEGGNVH